MQPRQQASVQNQSGLTLVELMVSIAISMIVFSGVVQVLVVSKTHFIGAGELAALQENARFALTFLSEEIRMAGYSGCKRSAGAQANAIRGSVDSWYLDRPGVQGYEGGESIFPEEFAAELAAGTDAIVVRRGQGTGLRVTNGGTPNAGHQGGAASIHVSAAHGFQRGQVLMLVAADCHAVGIFQMSGPLNTNAAATRIEHKPGIGVPGNCHSGLGSSYTCNAAGIIAPAISPMQSSYPAGSRILEMRSEAYYVGVSKSDSTMPALFRERMLVNGSTSAVYTAAEELVQGVDNLQILYGVDTDHGMPDGLANQYVTAAAVSDWSLVVSVRLSLRLRSAFPVYNSDVEFAEFAVGAGTDGADRFMRQVVTTTIQIRNS